MGILWLVECFSILMKRINYNSSVISFPIPCAAVMKSTEPSVPGSPLCIVWLTPSLMVVSQEYHTSSKARREKSLTANMECKEKRGTVSSGYHEFKDRVYRFLQQSGGTGRPPCTWICKEGLTDVRYPREADGGPGRPCSSDLGRVLRHGFSHDCY